MDSVVSGDFYHTAAGKIFSIRTSSKAWNIAIVSEAPFDEGYDSGGEKGPFYYYVEFDEQAGYGIQED